LINNGVPADSVSVYNIATPADYVAGGGSYLTSSKDRIINDVVRGLIERGFAKRPLPANIDILPGEGDNNGHSLSKTYLTGASDRIISDIQNQLENLSSSGESSSSDGCFIAPPSNITHKIKKSGFWIADGTAKNYVAIRDGYVNLSNAAYDLGVKAIAGAAQVLTKTFLFGGALNPDLPSESQGSLSSLPPSNVLDLTNTQAIQDFASEEKKSTRGPTSGNESDNIQLRAADGNKQEMTDGLLERVDLLKRQIANFTASILSNSQNQRQTSAFGQNQASASVANIESGQSSQGTGTVVQIQQQTVSEFQYTSSGGSGVGGDSGAVKKTYPKLLISEIQIASESDEKQEFVELYNPNDSEASLTDWYLHRKTKTGSNYSTFAANSLFEDRKILAKSYFIIARQGYLTSLADIFVDNPLTEDNSLILKNPNGEIVDKVGWGESQDYETASAQNPDAGKSIGRKENQQDTDNNSADFEINEPTFKVQNKTYVAPSPSASKDMAVPEVVFNNLGATQSKSSFTINFTITDVATDASPAGVSSYIFRWKEESGDWQEDSLNNTDGNPLTFSGTKNFSGSDGKNYYFQIKAKDSAGNQSDWLPEATATTKIDLPKKVLINEIQIDSKVGVGGTDDDWVELYNPNDVEVSLSGWSIQKHGSDNPCSLVKSFYKKNFNSNAKISPKGFFLVVGTSASDLLKSFADMTIGWSLSDNNTIYLVRSEDEISGGDDLDIVDKVGFGVQSCFSETSPALSPAEAKSIERKNLGLDTDNNLNDFKISDEITPKGNFPKSIIQDITNYFPTPSTNSPGAPLYTILLKWQTLSSNIDFFQVQYRLNGDLIDGGTGWKDWLDKTTKSQEYFQIVYTLFQDTAYHFRVRAQDKNGNLGDWSPELKLDFTNPVVINEVAYSGTGADSKDQWIELYNPTEKNIDLTDWKIISGTGTTTSLTISLQGTITAKGYFILERNDDNSLSDIAANQIFTLPIGTGFLSLRAPNNRYVDRFYVKSSGLSNEDFIKEGNHYSMERLSAYSFGSFSKNWKLNNLGNASGQNQNGKDRNGGQVYGTPGQKNSVDKMYTYYSFSFLQDTVLKKEFSPYLFESSVLVFQGVKLTIEPGTVVKFFDNKSNLMVHGTLKAVGTESENIIFTSFYDDEFGGDSNKDSGAADVRWLGIHFSPDSVNSQLENVRMRYGGSVFGSSPLTWGNVIWVEESSISLKNSILEKSRNRGVRLINSSSIIDSVQFLDFGSSDWPFNAEAKAVLVKGGSPTIKNSYFKNSYYGIHISNLSNTSTGEITLGDPTLENNQFEGSVKADVYNVNSP
jgi:hypothetical protein